MKFENPIMTISMFEVENVATTASVPATTTGVDAADAAADADMRGVTGTVAKIRIMY